jgi:hypothetical protein
MDTSLWECPDGSAGQPQSPARSSATRRQSSSRWRQWRPSAHGEWYTNTVSVPPFIPKRSFYQDRLGTKHRESSTQNRAVFPGVPMGGPSITGAVGKTASVARRLIAKTEHLPRQARDKQRKS